MQVPESIVHELVREFSSTGLGEKCEVAFELIVSTNAILLE
jgi:hypothetical protein